MLDAPLYVVDRSGFHQADSEAIEAKERLLLEIDIGYAATGTAPAVHILLPLERRVPVLAI